MAGALTTIRNRISKSRETAFRYPRYSGGASGMGASSWFDQLFGRLLQGADYDYVAEAGELWKNAVIAACLRFLLNTFPEPRLVVLRTVQDQDSEDKEGTTEIEVRDHPLLGLMEYPNEDDDDATAMAQAYCMDYNLFGNAYWLKLRNRAGRVTGLQPIPYGMMFPQIDKTGRKRVGEYIYRVDGDFVHYATTEVIQFRFGRDPVNARVGFQSLIGACRDICAENELSVLAASVARNMGIVPYLVSPAETGSEAVIPDKQKVALQEAFDDRTRDNRGRAMIMRRSFKVDRIGLSPDELMADKSRAIAVSRICGALGLDPMVVSLPSDSKTYSNYGESMTAAYEHNIVPTGNAYCTKLTRTFQHDPIRGTGEPGFLLPNERLAFDYSKVEAMQENRDLLFKRWGDLYKVGGCTRYEAKHKLGLPGDPVRDDVYVQDLAAAHQQSSLDAQSDMHDAQLQAQPKKYWQIKSASTAEEDMLHEFKRAASSGSHWVTIDGNHVEIGSDGQPTDPKWRTRLAGKSPKPAGVGVRHIEHTYSQGDKFFEKHDVADVTPSERKSIKGYALGDFSPINRALRNDKPVPSYLRNDAENLDAVLKRSKIPDNVVLRRGIQYDDVADLDNMEPGDEIEEKGFASTSLSNAFEGNVQLKIKANKGQSGIMIEHYTGNKEHEILLPRGSMYKINHVKKETDTLGKTTYHVSASLMD